MEIVDKLHAFLWNSMAGNNCNTYLIDGPKRILIDPGHFHLFGHVQSGLARLGLDIRDVGLVICTHAHPDHIQAAAQFKEEKVPTTLHEMEWQLVKRMEDHVKAFYGQTRDMVEPDFKLREGELNIGGIEFTVYHTPGHSPGSISLYWPSKKVLFTGDLIFNNGIGRTDLPGGDSGQLVDSIRRLSELDVEYLLPGHGDIVAGEKAVRDNFEYIERYWFGRI